jgi:glycosyltransferase involved in cell wall biosynthesis
MPHGMLDPYFQKAPGRKLKAMRNWIYWKFIEGKIINEADGVLFTCEEELCLARISFNPYKPKKEINVGYGIEDPPKYSPDMRSSFAKSCPGVKDKQYILFLGRIHEKKGIDMLLRAYLKLINNYTRHMNSVENDNNVVLNKEEYPKIVIAGPGLDTAYGKRIKQTAFQDTSLYNNVFFPGMLSGNAKWGAFYGSQAFILPGHQENFGVAIVEALACKKPVLISNKVNIWREIKKMDCGIVADDTIDGIYESLYSWIILSGEEKQKKQQNARFAFEQKFNIQTASLQFINAIIS